jgi:hypothetical protein
MKLSFLILFVASLIFTGCSTDLTPGKENVYAIIPAPVSIKEMPGHFTFTDKSKIVLSSVDGDNRLAADFLAILVKNPLVLQFLLLRVKKHPLVLF